MSVDTLLANLIENRTHENLDALISACSNRCIYVQYQDTMNVKRRLYMTPCNFVRLRSIVVHGTFHYTGHSKTAEYIGDILCEQVSHVKIVDLMDKSGAFFPYINLDDIDLSLYQIYRKDQEHNGIHCLVHSLAMSGVTDHNIVCELYVKYPTKDLTNLATKINRIIVLSYLDSAGYINMTKKFHPANKTDKAPIKLMIWKSHYMIYNRYALITLHKLYKANLFEPMSAATTLGMDQRVEFKPTDLTDSSCAVVPKKPSTPKNNIRISVADIMCAIHPHHVPIIYSRFCEGKYYTSSGGIDTTWSNFKHFLNTFDNVPGIRDVVYFKDLKYSWAILHRCPYINLKTIVMKDSLYYSVTIMFYGHLFEFRDLSKMIPKDMTEYPKTFNITCDITNLTCGNLYTSATCEPGNDSLNYTIELDHCPNNLVPHYNIVSDGTALTVTDAVRGDYLMFDGICVSKTISDIYPQYFRHGKYYHIAHAEKHVYNTCTVLYNGLMIFRERMLQLTEIDCLSKLTLPSLIHARMCNMGCYTNICESSGNLRKFIAESVHGGRVQSRLNMMYDVNAQIKVIDGKSLYPSAIKELCDIGGFPTGPCSAIDSWYNKDKFFHYIVRIRIVKVNKTQQLPFISYWDGTSRQYTNSLPPEPVVIDKITLEDWIAFHEIEYEFIEGVQWSSGSNATAGEYIQELYNIRHKYAEEGNSGMSQLCKLCLNSLYGKTITKPNTTKTVIKDNDKANAYMLKNFHKLVASEKCENQTIFTVHDNDDDHSNLGHVGGMILSMARRIMNRPLDLANTIRVPVLYMDTDSMHVVDSIGPGLDALAHAYYVKYGKILIGQQLGQFAEELCFDVPASNVHSVRQIILGKKVYLHVVHGTAVDGTLLTKNHFRIKAVNSHAVKEYPDSLALYESMYHGAEVKFDLAYGDGCIMNYAGSVSIREAYIRKLSFAGDKGTEEDLNQWVLQ